MADFYADSSGALISFTRSFFENQQMYGVAPPSGTAFKIDFDETTNAALVADIETNPKLYAAPGGVLQKQGVNVTIAAASQLYAIFDSVIAGVPKSTLEAFLVALWNGTATLAQTEKAVAYIGILLHVKFGLV